VPSADIDIRGHGADADADAEAGFAHSRQRSVLIWDMILAITSPAVMIDIMAG
jgi:hypothetical protein